MACNDVPHEFLSIGVCNEDGNSGTGLGVIDVVKHCSDSESERHEILTLTKQNLLPRHV